jgi:hypothetical protein
MSISPHPGRKTGKDRPTGIREIGRRNKLRERLVGIRNEERWGDD